MAGTQYVNFSEINELQRTIMQFVGVWVHTEKTPIPLSEIYKHMDTLHVEEATVRFSINALVRKGYIRKAITMTRKLSFVQLRSI